MNVFRLIPISTTPLLLLMLFIPSREFTGSNLSLIGLNNLGDDAIAILFFSLTNVYIYFTKNEKYRFWIGLNSTLGTALFIFPDFFKSIDSINPLYLGVMTLIYTLVPLSLFGQSDLRNIFTKTPQINQQLLGISGLALTFIIGFFSMQPTEQYLLKAIGIDFEKSGTNTHSYLSPEFSEIGFGNRIATILSVVFLVILFTLQIIGIAPSPVAYLPILLWFVLKIFSVLTSLGTDLFEPSDGWTPQDIAEYQPTKTTTGTFEFYIFALFTLIVIVNILISFVIQSSQNKKTPKEEN